MPLPLPSLQQKPQQKLNPLYKTRMCRNWSECGQCSYGYLCQYAHGWEEVQHWRHRQQERERQRRSARSARGKTRLAAMHARYLVNDQVIAAVLSLVDEDEDEDTTKPLPLLSYGVNDWLLRAPTLVGVPVPVSVPVSVRVV